MSLQQLLQHCFASKIDDQKYSLLFFTLLNHGHSRYRLINLTICLLSDTNSISHEALVSPMSPGQYMSIMYALTPQELET